MKYVIIGNGIIALSTAFRLACRAKGSDNITIVAPSHRLGSATLAAGAMLNSFAEIEASGLEHEVDLLRFELSHRSTRMWPDFERSIITAGGSDLPRGCSRCQVFSGGCFDRGTYVINNSAADDLDDENYSAIRQALVLFNEQFEDIDPADIPNYEPEQHVRATRALYIHGEGWLNPRLVIEKLDKVLRLFPQVEFIDKRVERINVASGLISSVGITGSQELEGDVYLVATGASVTPLIVNSRLGIDIQPIFYGVGTSLEIVTSGTPQAKCIRTPNRGLACGIYSVSFFVSPDHQANHILIGATNRISPTPIEQTNLSSIESLSKAAMEQINVNYYRALLHRVNVGWRPVSQDTYPLIGGCSIPNLYFATGTKRDGFHLAPLISETMADLMDGIQVDSKLAIFKPERKVLRTLTREQAVNKAVRHTISAWYQHGYSPAKSQMPKLVASAIRDRVERLHDEVGAVDWGIPPEMHDMYQYGHAKA